MIGTFLNQTANRIRTDLNIDSDKFTIGNIAMLESSGNNFNGNVVMSLVKIEEERSSRYKELSTEIRGDLFSHNPTVFLNLYLLFSIPKPSSDTDSLDTLTEIIQFFQGQNVFDHNDGFTHKAVFELCSLTFEQMNHLWGILGGKYVYSVLYKVRLLPVKRLPTDGETRILNITENETAL